MTTTDHAPARRAGAARAGRRGFATLTAALLVGATVAGCAGAAAPGPTVHAEVPPAPPAATAPADAPADAPAIERADVDAWLDGFLPAALDAADIAGASVAVVHDGQVVTARGYGWADTGADGGDPVPVDADRTLFRPGSVSKLVTATAVMQLVERGDVDLDTPVAEYVDIPVPDAFDEPVTLRHLLTHTAGFEERVGGLIGPEGTDVDLRATLATDPPEQVYRPGTVPAYSNYGNALAGYVVEQVSGERFEEYVQRHVLDPAGMTSSTFEQPVPDELRDRVSQGYATSAGQGQGFEVVSTAPAGALSASATDMARFMLDQLGTPVPGSEPVLQPETLALMQQPALDEDTLGTLAGGPRMTLGFFQEDRNGHRIVGHGGDTNWFHSHLQLYPDDGTGVFITMNSNGRGALDTLRIRDQLMHGFTDRYYPGTSGRTTVDADTAREHAQAAAGSYGQSRAARSTFLAALGVLQPTTVTATDDGRLQITPGPLSDRPALYEEVEPWVWQEVGGQRTIAARVTDGQVDAIGYDSAFALLRSPAADSVAVPVLAASAVVLLLSLLAWPAGWLLRRYAHRPRPGTAGRAARVATRVASAAALVALVGWFQVATSVMALQEAPAVLLRVLQGVQALGVLGLVPAVARVVGDVRRGAGWRSVTGGVLVLLALAGVAWFAVTYRLIAPSVSY